MGETTRQKLRIPVASFTTKFQRDMLKLYQDRGVFSITELIGYRMVSGAPPVRDCGGEYLRWEIRTNCYRPVAMHLT